MKLQTNDTRLLYTVHNSMVALFVHRKKEKVGVLRGEYKAKLSAILSSRHTPLYFCAHMCFKRVILYFLVILPGRLVLQASFRDFQCDVCDQSCCLSEGVAQLLVIRLELGDIGIIKQYTDVPTVKISWH